MLLLQKPKRVVSNFSFEQLQQVKDVCRDNLIKYKEKFGYQHFLQDVHSKKRPKSSYGEYRREQSTQLISRKHSYTVESHKYKTNKLLNNTSRCPNDQIQPKIQKRRPHTANQIARSHSHFQTFETVSRTGFQALFQNQQLSASLKSSQFKQNSTKHQLKVKSKNKYRSSSSTCVSFNPNVHIVKTGFSEPEQDMKTLLNEHNTLKHKKAIKQILTTKQNFYNPYNVTFSYVKPIKHLRSKSVTQLKKLCQQERNLNFDTRIKQIGKNSIMKNKTDLNNKKPQCSNSIHTVLSFKKPQRSAIKKTSCTWLNKNKECSYKDNNNEQDNNCILITQISCINKKLSQQQILNENLK